MIYSRLLHLKISCVPSHKEKQMLASHFSNPPRRSVSCQRRMPLQKSTRRWRRVSYQQAADRDFLAAEEARERREEEREEKRRKEDQEFLLKLAQVLRKWKVRVFNNFICARTCDSFSWFSFRLYSCCKLKDV